MRQARRRQVGRGRARSSSARAPPSPTRSPRTDRTRSSLFPPMAQSHASPTRSPRQVDAAPSDRSRTRTGASTRAGPASRTSRPSSSRQRSPRVNCASHPKPLLTPPLQPRVNLDDDGSHRSFQAIRISSISLRQIAAKLPVLGAHTIQIFSSFPVKHARRRPASVCEASARSRGLKPRSGPTAIDRVRLLARRRDGGASRERVEPPSALARRVDERAKSTHREGIGRFLSTNRWRRARRGSNLRRLSRPFSRARMRVAVDVFSPCVAQYRR